MSSYNNPVSNFDLTKSGVFLDEKGLRENNQRKAGIASPLVKRHETQSRQNHAAASPFLTRTEQHNYMQKRGLLPEGVKLRLPPQEDCVDFSHKDPISTVSDVESSWDDGKTREMRALESELGIQFTTNYEMVSQQTARGSNPTPRSANFRDVDSSCETRVMATISAPKSSFAENSVDSRFQNTVEMPVRQFRGVDSDFESHLPARKPKNIKEWNKYLFDQMTSLDVELTKEHLKGVQQEIYDKLKLIHLGHKASREDTKHLLDMHDALKVPSGNSVRTDVTKISRGAVVADVYRRGILEILGLARK